MPAGDISRAMQSSVRSRIGEPAMDDITDQEIYDYLSEAQMLLAMEEALDAAMLPLTEIRTGTWSTGVYSYPLPFDFLRERYVSVNGVMARRLALADLDALRTNPAFAPSKTRPFYSIADGYILFHTGSEDPDTLEYKIYYVRKPMWRRPVTSIAEVGGVWRLNTASNHNLTSSNEGDTLRYEESDTAGLYAGVNLTLGSYVDAYTFNLTGYTSGAASGGYVYHSFLGQVQSFEDPLLPKVFHGMMMDWAVSRCREQFGHFEEANRQMVHFMQRVESLKQHYGQGRPFDGVPGDPGRRVPAAPAEQG